MKKRTISALLAACVLLTGCAQQNTAENTQQDTMSRAEESDAQNAPDSSSGTAADTSGTGASEAAGTSAPSDPVPQTSPQASSQTAGEAASGSSAGTESSTAGTTAGTTGTTAGTTGTTAGTTGTTAGTTAEAAPAAGLSPAGTYEGTKGTSAYNYGEALQKSIIFYDLQRSGDLPDDIRTNWRGDSCLGDGSDAGLDLSGGFFDAGDNVKFNLPMAYSTALLAWSVAEDRAAYEKSGQLSYILDNIRWGNDYFIRCHPEANVYYYQVGDGNADHSWWGPAEVVDVQMKRPSYKVDLTNGGSTVAAGTAASLASCAVVFADSDSNYSEKCIKHAKELFDYAEKVKSDSGYTAANGFYQSHSGFTDELAFAAYWLYKATGDKSYLDKAESYYSQHTGDYNWALCWDDKSMGTAYLLAKETGRDIYRTNLEKHLDYWKNELKKTPKGLAYLDQWGALRYATTTAFLAVLYADSGICPESKKDGYEQFAKSQIDYALGSSGRSFVIGFGENYPKNPHHRTAHGSYTNNIGDPSETRHILYGALVGGPDMNDSYSDDRTNYTMGEVACDYNAGFTGALARFYSKYGGQTIKNFGAVDKVDDELYADASVNVSGADFIEIKALVYNKTAFPARNTNDLKLCYFFDISEIKEAGGSAMDLTVTTNYMQGGSASDVLCWNEAKNLYYVAIDFTGTDIYPGGQDSYKKEVQFRIRNTKGVWDNTNDPSFIDVAQVSIGTMTKAKNMALYEGSRLVYGTEPNENNTGTKISELIPAQPVSGNGGNGTGGYTGPGTVNNEPAVQVSDKGTVSVALDQQQASGKGGTIAFTLRITNTGDTGIDLSKLTADYFFTNDGGGDVVFECDYADIQGSNYRSVTETVSGAFTDAKGEKTDTRCRMSLSGGVLAGGETLGMNVRIHKSDWTEFDLGNDLSGANAGNITVTYNGRKL